jgi:hypothetical protein
MWWADVLSLPTMAFKMLSDCDSLAAIEKG